MISAVFEGSQTVDGTEWDLPSDSAVISTQTQSGAYQCILDLSALAIGNSYEFRIYEKVLATQRVIHLETFTGAQTPVNWPSPCILLMKGWTMTLKKTGGTDRNIDWSIRQVR